MQHKARKRFGQNFLKDELIIEKIITVINPKTPENIVEIGPGLGALTHKLLPLVTELIAIEIDRDLTEKLILSCKNLGKLNLYSEDVLNFDLKKLHKTTLRIVGNLPYNISTPLIFHLLDNINLIYDMHFMLQKEVAERMAAKPNNKNYGKLSIITQYYCDAELLFLVPADAFKPKPKVTSAIIKLTPKKEIKNKAINIDVFNKVASTAFNQRRKTLRNSLKNFFNEPQLNALNIDPKARPEQLIIDDFIKLANYLASSSC